MYLKALEIQGFKSFPDKTVLTFGDGITAIVGPNGSGKSNVADAIRWVMGEQSTRTLRGGRMEDVIFGGTRERSQVGFAEVSLIIENDGGLLPVDGSEVMVTRRYYRSGESEYYINRKSVRLKDINELFMDTGLGRDGYSIIGQGRIDEILSVRSSERRDVFEEAAGISRYRYRKEEAERKLASAQENLVRINDKISEIELQIDPLREQSEKARRYLLLRDELRGIEVTMWLDTLEKLRAASKKAFNDYQAAGDQLERARAELEGVYSLSEQCTEGIRQKEAEAGAARDELARLEDEAAQCENVIAVYNANMESNNENIARIEKELSEQETRAGDLEAQIEERRANIEQIRGRQSKLKAQLDELLGELERISQSAQGMTAKLEALQASEVLETAAAADAKSDLSAFTTAVQELAARKEAVNAELDQAESRLEEAGTAARAGREELEKAREDATSLSNTINGYELRQKSRQAKLDKAAERNSNLRVELSSAQSRIKMLTAMEKEYEGFSKSVRIVMQELERGSLKNVHGPVANLVRTQDRYTVAVETALGASSQSVVVDRAEDGKAAINLLKRRDAGRATFLPLDAVRGRGFEDKKVSGEEGFVGIASLLVSYDKKYGDIVTNLLGRTVVVEDMDSAIAISRKYSYRFRIVTLDGQVINAGGSMTGGSANRDAGILSRANELVRTTERAKKLSEEMAVSEKELADARRELDAVSYEIEVARAEKRQLEDRILRLESESEHHAVLIEGLERSRASFRDELDGIERRRAQIDVDIEKTGQVIAHKEQAAAAIRNEMEIMRQGRSGLQTETDSLSARMTEIKVAVSALDAEEGAAIRAVEEKERQKSDIDGGFEQLSASAQLYRDKNGAALAQLSEKQKELEELGLKTEEKERAISAINAKKLELEEQRDRSIKLSQEKSKELLDLERESARLENKKASAEMEEKQILDRLWDIYELSHSAAQAVRVEIESLAKAGRRAGELKKEIAALGAPNIGAIEEFERVNTRYKYLTEQRDDVERAKAELESISRNITSEMKKIFEQQFKVINESFGETFTEIFGGGSANLELEDESDILNCGIEIKVQPPGKSLKTITLLSGGEKAFVAIALYFAILRVRPTPFCVMDEIEAALDDVNIVRFTQYLRKMSDGTQFIIITHRRGTMEVADVLYGVTMMDQGVSRVLTINLNEAEKELVLK